jgi:hypothetical protein
MNDFRADARRVISPRHVRNFLSSLSSPSPGKEINICMID